MSKFRIAGWLATAGLLGAALITPTAALGVAGGNPPTSAEECGGYDYYFKIQTPTDGEFTDGSVGVETNWPGQTIVISNAANEDQSFDWTSTEVVSKVAVKYGNSYFYPSFDDLSGTVENDNQNGISHVTWCGNDDEAPSISIEPSISVEPSQSIESILPSQSTSPSGSVLAETGTPDRTLPPTDGLGSASTPNGTGWQLLLVAMAGLLAAILLVTPARKRR